MKPIITMSLAICFSIKGQYICTKQLLINIFVLTHVDEIIKSSCFWPKQSIYSNNKN